MTSPDTLEPLPAAITRRDFVSASVTGIAAATVPWQSAIRPQATDLASLTLAEAAALLKARRTSSVELTRACLARIDKLEPRLNAFITLIADRALESAEVADREIGGGRYRGPLHGIPIALKDNIDTAGIRTTAASALFADRVPSEDAEVARRLRQAGAILLGKLNMDEFANAGQSTESYFGPVHNPWALDREAGGSSGGSAAAVSADLCFGALGTDTGGSIRVPASHCSVVGLKPTYGRVSNRGVIPLCWSYDHTGPLAKTVEDAALILGAIAGFDEPDLASVNVPVPDYTAALQSPTQRLRVGIPRALFYDILEDDVQSAIDEALRTLKALVGPLVDVTLPPVLDLAGVVDAEMYAFHGPMFERAPGMYQLSTARTLRGQANTKGHQVILERRILEQRRREVAKVFQTVDVLVAPTVKYAPRTIKYWRERLDSDRAFPPEIWNTWLFNIFGLPAMSVPAGFTKEGLPVGIMFAAGPWNEPRMISIAAAFERATEWHKRKPPLVL